MSRKSIDQYKRELEKKIDDKMQEREVYIKKVGKLDNELITMVNQQYSLDPTKAKIICPTCKGGEYWVNEQGKKQICPSCFGEKFRWAELFVEEKK